MNTTYILKPIEMNRRTEEKNLGVKTTNMVKEDLVC